MKITSLLICLSLLASPHLSVADTTSSISSSANEGSPIKLSILSELVKDYPIALTASTVDDELSFTFGPKPDGFYCTLDIKIARQKDGTAKFTATFTEETKVTQSDGSTMIRNVGFQNLSTILSPGDEETLFSLGDKRFNIKSLKIKK